MSVRVALRDAASNRWMEYREPRHVIQAHRPRDVVPALRQVEARVQQERLWAAGFVAYEAAPAFDAAFQVLPGADFPLLYFALFEDSRPLSLRHEPSVHPYRLERWQPDISREEYRSRLARIKEHIRLGETYQVNYTFRLHSRLEGDAWPLFLDLVRRQETPYSCYFETDRFAICSVSPELFFQRRGEEILLRPMKGTVSRGRTVAEDREHRAWLRASAKDQAENLMIVDMIRNDVGRIAEIGSVQVPDLFQLERYSTLHQMTSTVTARTDKTLADVFQALFPCASITGAPKIRTTRIIASLESSPRNIYTGAIGLIRPDGSARFSVAIRTLLVEKEEGRAEYGIGSGIVWDSDSSLEYRECLVKSHLLKAQAPDFSLLESLLWDPDDGFFLLQNHLSRLGDSAEYFEFPLDGEQAESSLHSLVEDLPRVPHKVRLLLDRRGRVTCRAEPLGRKSGSPIALGLAHQPVDSSDPFLFHKTTHRAVYETALAAHPDCQDVLLWNEQGEVTEGCLGNIAVEMEGRLWTPPVECGLLAGTYRQHLIDRERLQERVIRVEELARCSRILWMNSVRGERPAILLGRGENAAKRP